MRKVKTYLLGVAGVTVLLFSVAKALDDPGIPADPIGGGQTWAIDVPDGHWTRNDTDEIETEGVKPQAHANLRLEVERVDAPGEWSEVQTHNFNLGQTTWEHTFTPATKWPTPHNDPENPDVNPYRIALRDQVGNVKANRTGHIIKTN